MTPGDRDPGAPGDGPGWDRVGALFETVMELEPGLREAALAEAAARDPALAAEVRSLLAAHAASTGFLDAPPVPRVPEPAPGDRVGPYRITGEIGRGGMGVVYRAVRDDATFTKTIALKRIDPVLRSDEVLRRFQAERQILALLDHPNIARLLDGGTAADGSPYLVMEFVDGRPLLEDCDARRLTIDDRLARFVVVCDAVQFAHQKLVVHRDIKSDNVLVTTDGSPRLLDFGIAKLLSPEPGGEATLTAPAHRMLTPDYASPEQVRGEPATVASDVYSLGVVLFELLTGARPHRFTTRSPEEILRVVTQHDPPRPSAAAARAGDDKARRRGTTPERLRRRLAGDLDTIVLKALERDTARRYASVDQLAQDVRRYLEGRPVFARGRSTAYLASRFVRRHRAAVATTAVVALSLVAGLAGTAWQAGVARTERDRATRRFDDVRQLAHAVMFDLHDAIANLPGSTPARELLVRHALRYLDRLAPESRGDLGLQHEIGIAYAKIGDVLGRPEFPNLGRTTDALHSYQRAIGVLDSAYAAAPESVMILRDRIVVTQRYADLLGAMGRHDEAVRQAVDAKRRINAYLANHPGDALWNDDLCVACDHLVDLRLAVADTAGALAECVENVTIARRRWHNAPGEPEHRRGLLIADAKMANLRAMRGERDSAAAYYADSERLAEAAVAALRHDTDASRDLSIVYGMHGQFLAEGGAIDSALAVYGRGVAIASALAASDPASALTQLDLADGHYQLAAILVKGRRFADAEQRYAEAFDRYGRVAAADTANADARTRMARAGRGAGEACAAQAQSTRGPDRARCRTRANDWFTKSLALYRTLGTAGALAGEDAAAPDSITRALAQLH